MFVLGLTGSIAMGKSTAAATFRALTVPVFDADRAVHRLLAPGGAAVAAVAAAFPGCARDGAIDRRALGRLAFAEPAALARLEAILHPKVRSLERRFLARCAAARRPLVVLDIPLLLETGGERLVDAVAVTSAPPAVQAQRVLGRPGMTAERLAAIRARQLPDAAEAPPGRLRDPNRPRAPPRGRDDRDAGRPAARPQGPGLAATLAGHGLSTLAISVASDRGLRHPEVE